MPLRGRVNVLDLVYLSAGAIIAATHHSYDHMHTAKRIGSPVLAILLWPLLFLGINLHGEYERMLSVVARNLAALSVV